MHMLRKASTIRELQNIGIVTSPTACLTISNILAINYNEHMVNSGSRRSAPPLPIAPQRLAPEKILFSAWPLQQGEWGAMLFCLASLLCWLFLPKLLTQQPVACWIASLCFFLTGWHYWLPVQYEFGLAGIQMRILGYNRLIPWIAIAKFELLHNGVWLYTEREHTSRRGTFIPFGNKKPEITAILEYYLTDS
jgi:hypothetical protein